MTPQERTDAVLEFCSDGMYFTSKDIAESLHLTPLQARRAIHPLVESGKILAQGNTRARTYRIKRKRARYGAIGTLDEPMYGATIKPLLYKHPEYLQEAYEDIGGGYTMKVAGGYVHTNDNGEPLLFTPNRPSKWQRIVAFLKGE